MLLGEGKAVDIIYLGLCKAFDIFPHIILDPELDLMDGILGG